MAKFKNNNLLLKTNQKIFLGSSNEAEIKYDGADLLIDSSVKIPEHVAIGNQAEVDQFGLKVLGINENFTTGDGGFGLSINVNSSVNSGTAWTGSIAAITQTATTLHSIVQGAFLFANCTGDGVTVADLIGVKGGISVPADNGSITNAMGGWFVAGTGFSMSNTAFTNMMGGRFQILDFGSGDIDITNGYGVLVESPGYTPTGTLTNLYGVHVQDQSGSGFTNHFNIFSAGAGSENKFEGNVEVEGTLSTDTISPVDSTGVTFLGDIICDDLFTSGDTIHVGDGQIKSSSGNVELYNNGSKVFETISTGFALPGSTDINFEYVGAVFTIDAGTTQLLQLQNGGPGACIFGKTTSRFRIETNNHIANLTLNGVSQLSASQTALTLGGVGSGNQNITINQNTNTITFDMGESNALVATQFGSVEIYHNAGGGGSAVKVFETLTDGVRINDLIDINTIDTTESTGIIVNGDIHCDDLFTSGDTIHLGNNALLKSPAGTDFSVEVSGVEYMNLEANTQTLGVSTATSQLWMSESVGGLIYGYVGGTLMLAMGGTTQSIQLGDLANTNLLLNSNANIATLEAANKTALVATGNAGVDLYYNNTKVFETQQDGILVDTNCSIKMSGSVLEILNLGHGQEIQLKAENLAGTPTLMIGAIPDGAASLYYAGDVKLATDSTGVIATGDVVADAFIGDGSQLTGLPAASSISEGNSNVTVTDTGTGNISTTVDGTLIQYLEDGQQIYGGSGDTQIVLNQDGNWMSMGVGSTGIVTFLQTSQTIGIFNDSRLVVDQAGNKVDLYGGNVLAASFADDGVTITGPLYAGGIQQDDSYVQVVDDGTDAGYIEIVADGEQVGYFDAESNSIRIGKESGAFKTTLTDTSAKITLNTTDVIQANSDQVRLGASSTDFVVDHVSDYFSGRINGTSVLSIADSSQRIGKVAGGYIVAGASAADLYYSGNKKFETTTDGAKVTGDLEITGNLKGGFTVQRVYGDYTAEDGDVILVDGTAEVTITLTESTDAHIVVKSLQDDTVNVVGATGDVDDQPEFELTAKYWSGTFVCDGTDWFVI